MGYCIKCGAKVSEGMKFCPECGTKIPEENRENCANEPGGANQSAGAGENSAESGFNPYENYRQTGSCGQGKAYQCGGAAYRDYRRNDYNPATHFAPGDVSANKAMGVLSYIGILVLVPLIAGDKTSEYVRHHLNQGLLLWFAGILINWFTGGSFFGFSLYSILGHGFPVWWWLSAVGAVIGLAIFICEIVGIVFACRGERRPLPLIGTVKIFN